MQIIVKGLKGFKIYPENQDYVLEKFCKYQKLVKEPAILEIAFEHTHGQRGSIDKKIHLNFTMPGMAKQEHIEELAEHFPESIDRLEKRFEKFILREKEKRVEDNHRQI